MHFAVAKCTSASAEGKHHKVWQDALRYVTSTQGLHATPCDPGVPMPEGIQQARQGLRALVLDVTYWGVSTYVGVSKKGRCNHLMIVNGLMISFRKELCRPTKIASR